MLAVNKKKLKIAVVGPESTGKSSMTKFLSKYYKSTYVPEYARYYCKNLNNKYTIQDELNMFYGQIALEDAILENTEGDIVFCDTTILTVKIWSDHLFKHTPAPVLEEIAQRKYDLYLLMDIDLPWEEDPLRDFPEDRDYFMQVWKRELKSLNTMYQLISGIGKDRNIAAIEACQQFISSTL